MNHMTRIIREMNFYFDFEFHFFQMKHVKNWIQMRKEDPNAMAFEKGQ